MSNYFISSEVILNWNRPQGLNRVADDNDDVGCTTEERKESERGRRKERRQRIAVNTVKV
jgi:hypothetical protein